MNIIKNIKEGWNKFWNETLGEDYTDAELVGLNINSSNKTEAILAQSLVDIESRYIENYGRSKFGLKGIKLSQNQLSEKKSVVNEKKGEREKER